MVLAVINSYERARSGCRQQRIKAEVADFLERFKDDKAADGRQRTQHLTIPPLTTKSRPSRGVDGWVFMALARQECHWELPAIIPQSLHS